MKEILRKIGYFIFFKLVFHITEYDKENLEPNTSYILCPNHISESDGPIMWSTLKEIRIMAKKVLFVPPFGYILKSLDIVPVDRSQHFGEEIRGAVKFMNGSTTPKYYLLFPQGTISDINKNTINRVKPGAFMIALMTKTPFVPIFIEQPHFMKKSRIIYGKPISIEPYLAKDDTIVDYDQIDKMRKLWMKEVKELQKKALTFEDRPINIPKLNIKHSTNNDG